jgi:hypothetical protein
LQASAVCKYLLGFGNHGYMRALGQPRKKKTQRLRQKQNVATSSTQLKEEPSG